MNYYNLKLELNQKYDIRISCISTSIYESYLEVYKFINKKYKINDLSQQLTLDLYANNLKIKEAINASEQETKIINSRFNIICDGISLSVGSYN